MGRDQHGLASLQSRNDGAVPVRQSSIYGVLQTFGTRHVLFRNVRVFVVVARPVLTLSSQGGGGVSKDRLHNCTRSLLSPKLSRSLTTVDSHVIHEMPSTRPEHREETILRRNLKLGNFLREVST